jgi:hypothetical protein
MTPQGNGNKTVTASSQFDDMSEHSDKYLGQETRLVDSIVNIDETDEGYLVLAKWLPYPTTLLEQGPVACESKGDRHFLIRFVGKRDREFYAIRGNKFLLEGTVEGIKQGVVNVVGPKKDLILINAKCVHLWETGESEVNSGQGDSEYPPVRQRTLCAD